MLKHLSGSAKTFLLLAFLPCVISVTGCDKTANLGGFFVITDDCVLDQFGFPICVPHPGAQVNGSWVRDLDNRAAGNILNFPSGGAGFITTDATGHFFVQYGRMPAVWNSGVLWNVPCGQSGQTSAVGSFNVTFEDPNIGWACGPVPPPPPPQGNPQFGLVGSIPATFTIQGTSGLSTQNGTPKLYVYAYNSAPNTPVLEFQGSAISVSADGTGATFNFPTAPGGGALPEGVYIYGLWNQTSPGVLRNAGVSYLSVGSNDTSNPTPYGVQVVDVSYKGQNCSFDGLNTYCDYPYFGSSQFPLVTISSLGQIRFNGGTIGVGSQPTAVLVYANSSQTVYFDSWGSYQTTTQPSRAIVANFGSNSVSIVDLVNGVVAGTVPVGAQPTALLVKDDESKAYVANYGSSSISEIDLASNAASRVASVGFQPAALARDPSGTALWVGGLNYISKVDLNSFSVVQTFSVSGQVTSIAVSSGQSAIVYTVVTTGGASMTFQAQQMALASASVQGSYAQYTIPNFSAYAAPGGSSGGATTPPGWLMANGALVSTNFGNSAAVVGTPTGFAVLDLVGKTQVMQGSTPSAVRGIATNASQGIVYLTAPDSNSLITVPLPAVQ